MIADVIGTLIFEFLLWPAEWLTDRLWRGHRKEPLWRRVISGTFRSLLTVLIFVVWIAILIGIPLGIYLLVTHG